MTQVEMVREYVDPAAQRIGKLYQRGEEAAQKSIEEDEKSEKAFIACGKELIARKASMKHGEWTPWLKANEKVLGFGESTAQRLMKFASVPTTTTELWGNTARDQIPRPTRDLAPPRQPPTPAELIADVLQRMFSRFTELSNDQLREAFEMALARRP